MLKYDRYLGVMSATNCSFVNMNKYNVNTRYDNKFEALKKLRPSWERGFNRILASNLGIDVQERIRHPQ